MSEDTRTETELEERRGEGTPPIPGILVVYQRGVCRLGVHVIDRLRTVGRGDEADVVLDDAGVSRVQASLEPAPGGLLLTDAGSHNGTWVDGAKVTVARHFVRYGALIRMGKTLAFAAGDVGRFLTSAAVDAPLVGGVSLADVRAGIGMASMSTAPVLIEGETGTGKELVARAIHEATERTGELVGLNCAALPAELVEAELFGHSRGAFSGSVAGRAGLFRTAHRGTLLLDEIGELPPTAQAKLLRVIETHEVRPVGEDRSTPVDVRLIAASNRDLGELTRNGAFRADLLHRIAVITIRMPPLRERREDVPALSNHFLAGQRVELDVHAMELLLGRSWPGNVRELKNVVTAAALRARQAGHDHIGAADVTPSLQASEDDERSTRSTLIAALVEAGGNVTRAAQTLGVARSGLYETLKRLGIDPAEFRKP